MGLNYSIHLYCHVEQVGAILRAAAERMVGSDELDLELPGGERVRLAARAYTWDKNYAHVPVGPGPVPYGEPDGIVVALCCRADKRIRRYLRENRQLDDLFWLAGVEYVRLDGISLGVRVGERLAEVSFQAPSSRMSTLFYDSDTVRDLFLDILAQGQGLAAVLDEEEDDFFRLEDPRVKITVADRWGYPIWGWRRDVPPHEVDHYFEQILGQIEPLCRAGPVIGADYSFFLFFPKEEYTSLLRTVGEWAASPYPWRTELVLPDGGAVIVPFRASEGNERTISLLPGSKVCLHARLSFPAGDREYRGHGDPEQAAALLAGGEALHVHLWVYMGDQHVGLLFSPPNPRTGWFFVESAAVHRALSQLLENHGGLLGALTNGADERVYLLPRFDACLEVVDLADYCGDEIDVEGLLYVFQEHAPQPTRPPTTDLSPLGTGEA